MQNTGTRRDGEGRLGKSDAGGGDEAVRAAAAQRWQCRDWGAEIEGDSESNPGRSWMEGQMILIELPHQGGDVQKCIQWMGFICSTTANYMYWPRVGVQLKRADHSHRAHNCSHGAEITVDLHDASNSESVPGHRLLYTVTLYTCAPYSNWFNYIFLFSFNLITRDGISFLPNERMLALSHDSCERNLYHNL